MIAAEYAKRGATVVIQGRNPQRIEETVRLCEEAGAEKSKVTYFCHYFCTYVTLPVTKTLLAKQHPK